MNRRPAPTPLRPIPPRQSPGRRPAPLLRSSGWRGRLTPFRIGIGLALVGSLLFILIGFLNRDANQIPILTAGLAVLGLTMLAVAITCVVTVIRAARDGRDASAFWAALAGGVAVMGAAGALAAAVILALVWRSAQV
jgi:hypothetical protein